MTPRPDVSILEAPSYYFCAVLEKSIKTYRRVALVFAGGTVIGNTPGKGNLVDRVSDIPAWMKQLDELRMVADFEPFFLSGERETRLGSKELVVLGETIRTLYDDFDSIVVLHRLQTIEYAAAAVSLMVQNPGKPIVFTSSPYTVHGHGANAKLTPVFAEYHGLGVKANLLNALHIATSDVRGVMLMFGNRLMPGPHVERNSDVAVNPFTTIGDHTYGAVDFGLRLTMQRAPRRLRKKPVYRIALANDVHAIAALPALSLGHAGFPMQGAKAIILRMEEKQSFDSLTMEDLAQIARETLVVIHAPRGLVHALPPGIVGITNMTYPMTFVKTMWVLSQTETRANAARLLTKNIVGEVIG